MKAGVWVLCAALALHAPASLDGQTRESRLDRVFTGLVYRPLSEVEIEAGATPALDPDASADPSLVESPHDPSVRYRVDGHVLRSVDGGVSWSAIGPEPGAEVEEVPGRSEGRAESPAGSAGPPVPTTVSESPMEPGLIWVGLSDGSLRLTRDGGASWAMLEGPAANGLPARAVMPSSHRGGRTYVIAESAEPGPWVYRTDDYGAAWALLSGEFNGLPREHPVTVVREDPEREGLLFAGTPVGVFVTFDDGGSWDLFQFGLPDGPVADVRVLGRDLVVDLIGHGLWVMDEIGPLRQVMDGLTTGEPYLFEPSPIYLDRLPADEGIADARGAIFDYLLPSIVRVVRLEVLDDQGRMLVTFSGVRGSGPGADGGSSDSNFRRVPGTSSGVHRIVWDLTVPGSSQDGMERAPPGNYVLRMVVDGLVRERAFEVVREGA